MTERLLTATDVADLLNVPESWVREATRQERMPHLHLGRYIRYHASAIDQWLAQQTDGAERYPISRRRG